MASLCELCGYHMKRSAFVGFVCPLVVVDPVTAYVSAFLGLAGAFRVVGGMYARAGAAKALALIAPKWWPQASRSTPMPF